MDINSFLNPKMYDKIALLPPEALKYLLNQLRLKNADVIDKAQMLKVVKIATKALDKDIKNKQQDSSLKKSNLKKFFFLPFKKIIFDGVGHNYQDGRISSNSLDKIWDYVNKYLLHDDIEGFEKAFKNAMIKKEAKKAKIIVDEFNRLVGQRLTEVIQECNKNELEIRRLAMMMGDDVILHDAKQLAFYLQNIGEMERAIRYFSVEITDFSGDKLKKVTDELTTVKDKNIHFLPLYTALLINALKHPEHALRIIQSYYRIDDAVAASNSDLNIIGEILLFNANINVSQFCNLEDEKGAEKLHAFIKYATLILGMEREFNISALSSWGVSIIKMREMVSTQLSKHISATPIMLQQSLGNYQNKSKDGYITEINDYDIKILNAKIRILHGIKAYIAASTCSALFSDTYNKTMGMINKISDDIVDHIRKESPENKLILKQYLEAAKSLIIITKDQQQADIYYKRGILAMRDELV